jgi:hypothetical protein
MRAFKYNGKEETSLRRFLILILTFLSFAVCPVRADLVFDSGYNTYDESYGYNAEVWALNDAILDVLGGQIGKLEYAHNSVGNIHAGMIDLLWTDDNTVVNIYGGQLLGVAAFPDSIIKLHAYDTIYHTSGGLYDEPWIEGVYVISDEPFNFSFYDEESYSRFQIVPEPCTFLMLCSGIFLLRKRLLS